MRDTYVDENAKGNPEENADDKVDRPVGEGAREGYKPDEGEENAKGGGDLGENESPLLTTCSLVAMKVFAIDTRDDGGKDELSAAQDQADKTVESHDGRREAKVYK